MSIMRIAVAGTDGLAIQIARCIEEETSHQLMLLSRSSQPTLSQYFQVATVNYADESNLTYALRGIDTIISTVTGPSQIALIKAAIAARVRRFAPAEFEGPPHARPINPQDVLDRGRTLALQWLNRYSANIESTIFVCGVFYERFKRDGLAQARIGLGTGWSGPGDYIMDCQNMTARVPVSGANGQPDVTICMTSVRDVARFVTRALELPSWPPELRMRGERVSVQMLVRLVQQIMQQDFNPYISHNMGTLRSELAVAAAHNDRARGMRIHTLIATAEGRYDFAHTNLNEIFSDVQPERFAAWFRREWGMEQ